MLSDAATESICVCDVGFAGPRCAECVPDANGFTYELQTDTAACLPSCAAAGFDCASRGGCVLGVNGPRCACGAQEEDSNGDGVCEPVGCVPSAGGFECGCTAVSHADISGQAICYDDCPDSATCADTPIGPQTDQCVVYVDGQTGRIDNDGSSWGEAYNRLEDAVVSAISKKCSSVWVRGDPIDAATEGVLSISSGADFFVVGGFSATDATFADWVRSRAVRTRSYLPRISGTQGTEPRSPPLSVFSRQLLLGDGVWLMGFDSDGMANPGPAVEVASNARVYMLRSVVRDRSSTAILVPGNGAALHLYDTLVLANSSAQGPGGLLVEEGATVELRRSAFVGNTTLDATAAGAASFAGRNAVVEDSYFTDNTGPKAGALRFDHPGDTGVLAIRRSVFSGNRGAVGSAISTYAGRTAGSPPVLHIEACLFIGSQGESVIDSIYGVNMTRSTIIAFESVALPRPAVVVGTSSPSLIRGSLLARSAVTAASLRGPLVSGRVTGDRNASTAPLCADTDAACVVGSLALDISEVLQISSPLPTTANASTAAGLIEVSAVQAVDSSLGGFVLLAGETGPVATVGGAPMTLVFHPRPTGATSMRSVNFLSGSGSPLVDAGYGSRDGSDGVGAYDLSGQTAFDVLEFTNDGLGRPPYTDIGCFEWR